MATSKVDIEVSASGAEAAAAKLADVGRAGDEAMKKVATHPPIKKQESKPTENKN